MAKLQQLRALIGLVAHFLCVRSEYACTEPEFNAVCLMQMRPGESARKPVAPGIFTLTTNTPLGWTQEIHAGQGNVAFADGSVHQFSSSRLHYQSRQQGVAANHLAIP